MIEVINIINLLGRLWASIDLKYKKYFFYILCLIVITACFEFLSIGLVLPFLSILTAPDVIFENPSNEYYLALLHIRDTSDLLIKTTAFFVLVSVLAGFFRVFLLWALTKFSLKTCADIGSKVYLKTLYQPYKVHISRNSSDVVNGLITQTHSVIYDIVMPIMFLLSSSLMALIIFVGLIFLNPLIAITSTLGFALIYLGLILMTKNKLLKNSLIIAKESTEIVKTVQEGMGGIRDILLDGSQIPYWNSYQKSNVPLRNTQASTAFIGSSPRYVIESISMLILAFIAYYFASKSNQGVLEIMPFLGVLAIGAQRLLPMLQQVYSSITSINGARYNLLSIVSLLEQPMPDEKAIFSLRKLNIQLRKKIIIQNVSYRYDEGSPWVLKNLTLEINKGDRVGFVGPSGGGKSTLIDIVMGLLEPVEGVVSIDDKVLTPEIIVAWQKQIAHVPQTIFLSDATIAENIAFGVPASEIDYLLVHDCARRAQLSRNIESWANGYSTIVGERGVKLSGGQRQRIGIARALYKRASIIIFDEATSALDVETEKAIMETIDHIGSNITIIIIAHRITTLKKCNRIIELANCNIKSVNYEAL